MLNGAGLRIYERFVRVMNDLMIFLTEIRASHAGRGSRASNFLKIIKSFLAHSILLNPQSSTIEMS
jgi:hypothetical protein